MRDGATEGIKRGLLLQRHGEASQPLGKIGHVIFVAPSPFARGGSGADSLGPKRLRIERRAREQAAPPCCFQPAIEALDQQHTGERMIAPGRVHLG